MQQARCTRAFARQLCAEWHGARRIAVACRYAQELLLQKDISLVLNVKLELLDRVARCTGALVRVQAEATDGVCCLSLLLHADVYLGSEPAATPGTAPT